MSMFIDPVRSAQRKVEDLRRRLAYFDNNAIACTAASVLRRDLRAAEEDLVRVRDHECSRTCAVTENDRIEMKAEHLPVEPQDEAVTGPCP